MLGDLIVKGDAKSLVHAISMGSMKRRPSLFVFLPELYDSPTGHNFSLNILANPKASTLVESFVEGQHHHAWMVNSLLFKSGWAGVELEKKVERMPSCPPVLKGRGSLLTCH